MKKNLKYVKLNLLSFTKVFSIVENTIQMCMGGGV